MLLPKIVIDVMCAFSLIPVTRNVDLLIIVTGIPIVTGLVHEPPPLALGLVPLANLAGGLADGVGVDTHLVVMLSVMKGSTSNTLASSIACWISSLTDSLSSAGSGSEVEGG